MSKIMREQREEMKTNFALIRKRITEANAEIAVLRAKAKKLEDAKAEHDHRYATARARIAELRNLIEEREQELADVESRIPANKSKMIELASLCGENLHFKKTLERTRKELEETEKKRDEANHVAKERTEDCWKAAQKLHSLEVQTQDTELKLDMAMRRIAVARDKLNAAQAQTSSVSKNYEDVSETELERRLSQVLEKVNTAKERRKKAEEDVLHMTWRTEALDNEIKEYYAKMSAMYNGQRDLASAKLL